MLFCHLECIASLIQGLCIFFLENLLYLKQPVSFLKDSFIFWCSWITYACLSIIFSQNNHARLPGFLRKAKPAHAISYGGKL